MADDTTYRRALLKKLRHVNELQRLPQLNAAQQAKLATLPQLLAELEGHGWLPEPEAATSLVPTKPAPPRDRPTSLERSLGATTSVAALSQALAHAPRLAGREAAHAVYWLARLLQQERELKAPAPFVSLLSSLSAVAHELGSRELSKAAWALGKLPTTLQPAAASALRSLATRAAAMTRGGDGGGGSGGSLDCRALVALLHAHGTAGRAPAAATLRSLCAHGASLLTAATPQDVANALWSLARFHGGSASSSAACSAAAVPSSSSAAATAPGAVSPDEAFLLALRARFVVLLASADGLKPQELSMAVWALAKLDALSGDVLACVTAVLLTDGCCRALSAQGAANCLWALARAEPLPAPAVVEALATQALARSSDLSGQGVANVCAAISRLHGRGSVDGGGSGGSGGGEAMVASLLSRIPVLLKQLGPTDVGEVAWALGRLALTAHGGGDGGGSGGGGDGTAAAAAAAAAAALGPMRQAAAAVWRRAAELGGAARLDWQAAAHLDFSLRMLGGDAEAAADAARLLPKVSEAARRSIEEMQVRRGVLDAAAARALLAARPWTSLAAGSSVLILCCGSAGECFAMVRGALADARLKVQTWNRFSDAAAGLEGEEWPRGGAFDAAVLRLPHTRAGLELALHAAASRLKPGAPLWVGGCHCEGIDAAPARIGATRLFEGERARGGAGSGSGVVASQRGSGASEEGFDVGGAVVEARRSSAPGGVLRAEPAAWEERGELRLGGGGGDAVPWLTLPGLFAGGGLDVMTAALLRVLPSPPSPTAAVLDFCCGSGTIGAALRASTASLRLHMLDADALSLRAAAPNLPGATLHLSDCWAALPPSLRFDWIVSNPPVHNGVQPDFRVLLQLVEGAAKRLLPGGVVYIVCQGYVPVGRLLALQPLLRHSAAACADDGRFTVWRAVREAEGARSPLSTEAPDERLRLGRPTGTGVSLKRARRSWGKRKAAKAAARDTATGQGNRVRHTC